MAAATEWFFYHLETRGVEPSLPPLLEKCLERGWRVLVSSPIEARLAALDESLWSLEPGSFLPHAREGQPGVDPTRQPVLLSGRVEAANGAQALVLLDGQSVSPAVTGFARCMVMFDDVDHAVRDTARRLYKAVRDGGGKPRYFQQAETGWVEKG
jgi:DNA polymerase-3 subunit chi